jgi:hypothetical protein
MNLEICRTFSKNTNQYQFSVNYIKLKQNFSMRIDGWMDGWKHGRTDMSKLIVAFHKLAKAPANDDLACWVIYSLTTNDLYRRRAVSPSKNIHEKPTNAPIIHSVY